MKRHMSALLAPYAAAFLTAALAPDAAWWVALGLFGALSMAALVLLSAVVVDFRYREPKGLV